MKKLLENLRKKRKETESLAKKVEEKSDPTEREHWYGVTKGLQLAINTIEEFGNIEEKIIVELLMSDSKDPNSEWSLFYTLAFDQQFDFSWLNPQKLAENFVFKLRKKVK